MTGPTATTRGRRSLSKGRLEAFSDGVFAIAITLLVLDIAVRPGGSPWEEVLSAWPSYVGYVVSFLTIGVAWIAHTALTEELEYVDSVFLRLNILLLLVVVFVPFPTTLVTEAFGDREAERVAATVYGVTLLLVRLVGMAMDRYARRQGLYKATSDQDTELRRSRTKGRYAVALYVIVIVVGLLAPGIEIAAYFAIAVYLIVPFKELLHRTT